MAIYRSKLNFTDLSRELNRHARSDRGLTLSTQALRERRDLRLEAAIQLASDEALRAEPIATRFAQDEAFAQLAVDALNYVPRRWEANFTAELECSDAMLEAELARRSSGKADAPAPTSTPASSAPAPPDPPGKPPAHDKETERNSTVAPLTVPVPKISAPDMALIRKLVDRQLGFLTNFKTLAQALHDRPRPDPWRLDEIVPLEIGQSLIAADNLNEHRYRFLLDNSALPIAVVAAPTEPAGKQAQDLVALFDAFASVLEFSGPSIDALVAAGYLPATITSEAFANARKLLAGPDRSPELVERAARTGDLLRRALAERGQLLGQVLIALEKYRVYVERDKRSPAQILQAFARYFPAPASGSEVAPKSLTERIGDSLAGSLMGVVLATGTGLTTFKSALERERATRASMMVPMLGDSELAVLWELWRNRLLLWIEDGVSQIADLGEEDIVTAVQGRPPGSIFKLDLTTMTPRDWSAVVVAGLPDSAGGSDIPGWVTFVGLYALGFDGSVLNALADGFGSRFSDRPPLDIVTIGRIVTKAPISAPRGLLLLARGDGAPILGDETGDQPVIVVAQSEFQRYVAAVEWLIAAGVVEGTVDESE